MTYFKALGWPPALAHTPTPAELALGVKATSIVLSEPQSDQVWRLPAGNLVLDPEAALLFIDFSTGDTLHLSGRAETQWDAADVPGAQRAVVFQTEAWVHVKAALPIQQQGPVESSPYNPTLSASAGNLQVMRSLHTCSLACSHSRRRAG